jgi:hypothetical protein
MNDSTDTDTLPVPSTDNTLRQPAFANDQGDQTADFLSREYESPEEAHTAGVAPAYAAGVFRDAGMDDLAGKYDSYAQSLTPQATPPVPAWDSIASHPDFQKLSPDAQSAVVDQYAQHAKSFTATLPNAPESSVLDDHFSQWSQKTKDFLANPLTPEQKAGVEAGQQQFPGGVNPAPEGSPEAQDATRARFLSSNEIPSATATAPSATEAATDVPQLTLQGQVPLRLPEPEKEPQTVQDAYHEAGGGVGGIINAVDWVSKQPIISDDQAKQLIGTAASTARLAASATGNTAAEQGVEERLAQELSNWTSPEGLGQLVVLKNPVARAMFAGQALAQIPSDIAGVKAAIDSGDGRALGGAIVGAALNAVMGVAMAKEPLGAARPAAERFLFDLKIAQDTAPTMPETAKALVDSAHTDFQTATTAVRAQPKQPQEPSDVAPQTEPLIQAGSRYQPAQNGTEPPPLTRSDVQHARDFADQLTAGETLTDTGQRQWQVGVTNEGGVTLEQVKAGEPTGSVQTIKDGNGEYDPAGLEFLSRTQREVGEGKQQGGAGLVGQTAGALPQPAENPTAKEVGTTGESEALPNGQTEQAVNKPQTAAGNKPVSTELSTTDLPHYAQGAIQAASRATFGGKPGILDSKWTRETVPISSLKLGNEMLFDKSSTFQPRTSQSKGPIVVDSTGEIIDGNNRVYEALQRGDSSIEVFRQKGSAEAAQPAQQPAENPTAKEAGATAESGALPNGQTEQPATPSAEQPAAPAQQTPDFANTVKDFANRIGFEDHSPETITEATQALLKEQGLKEGPTTPSPEAQALLQKPEFQDAYQKNVLDKIFDSVREKFAADVSEAQKLGIADLNTAFNAAPLIKALTQKAVAATQLGKFTDFRRSILNWSARAQFNTGEVRETFARLRKAVPDEVKRNAITNWIQAGGDADLLRQRAAATKDAKLQAGYNAALSMTPGELKLAQEVRNTYSRLLKRANAYGIEIPELENYVTQIWKRQPLREFVVSSNRRLSDSIQFAKKRYYNSFFDGEQKGLKPQTKDIADLLTLYLNEVNNATNAKAFVGDLAKAKASDGMPLVAPRGWSKVIENDKSGARLVFPDLRNKDTSGYRVIDQPALHQWKWIGEEDGKPVLLKGDLAVHPEIYHHLKNVLSDSAIREWYRSPSENPLSDIPKAAAKFLIDDVQQTVKATMLGFLSPFHQVQEGTHAIGHRVNPFGGLPKIDLSDPRQMDAAQHGLMLLPDRISAEQFKEGLDGSTKNLLAKALGKGPAIARQVKEWSDAYQDYLFHSYIPGLKLKTYDHMLERNQQRYAGELKSGQVSLDEVKYLSAQQSNAAYGHLNYADMGRNPTLQHIAQTFLLAPDFLEARARFAGQAAKGLVSKGGKEQLMALATLAGIFYLNARIMNKLSDDDYHWDEPFAVIHGNRRYAMRSVPEDIWRAFQDSRKFIYGRLSPIVGRGAIQLLSGVNYRGEPTDAGETIKELAAGTVPLTVQPATRGLTETTRDNPVSPWEQLMGALGLQITRYSPEVKLYQEMDRWVKNHGSKYGLDSHRAVYPTSKYRMLRYALDDNDIGRAESIYKSLAAAGGDKTAKNFRNSLNHPFTGSRASDEAFQQYLESRGKSQVWEKAVNHREELLARFDSFAP